MPSVCMVGLILRFYSFSNLESLDLLAFFKHLNVIIISYHWDYHAHHILIPVFQLYQHQANPVLIIHDMIKFYLTSLRQYVQNLMKALMFYNQ